MANQYLKFITQWDGRALKQGSKDAEKSLNKTENASEKLKDSFVQIAVATGVAATALYNMAKDGAAIDLASKKFDRLAVNIGTTGVALRDDLADATDGLMSKSEQMALAADLMSLGLAKTHDQAIRLSTVASQLGMNMNQLVLTLTNRTTMRFDALGVAVDGFDKKVQALEESGLSVEDAFTEAFLQQAEEQIEKVGSVAETTAGQLMMAEAATKDFVDGIKVGVSDMAGPLAEWYSGMVNNINAGEALSDQLFELIDAGFLAEDQYKELAFAVQWSTSRHEEAEAVLGEYNQMVNSAIQYEERRQQLVEGGIPIIEDAAEANMELADSIEDVNAGLGRQIEKYIEQIQFMQSGGLEIQNRVNEAMQGLADHSLSAADTLRILQDEAINTARITGELNGMTLEDLQEWLNGMNFSLKDARATAMRLYGELNRLNGLEVTAMVNIIQNGRVPNLSAIKGGAQGENVTKWIPQQAGGDFIVPPSFVGDSFPVRATAGERVRTTTASQTGQERLEKRLEARQRDRRLAQMIAQELAGVM